MAERGRPKRCGRSLFRESSCLWYQTPPAQYETVSGVSTVYPGAALALQNAAGGEIVLDVIAGVQTADLHPVLGVEAWTMLPSPMYRPTWVG